MKKVFLLIVSLFLFIVTGCDGKIESPALTYSNYSENHRAYDLLELGFVYEEEVANPYDSSEISMDAIITFNNKTISVPMFYYESYERSLNNDVEKLSPTNNNGWRLRYTPLEAGEYHIVAEV